MAGGGVMYKLLMKAFPNFYKGNSVYALYPFTVPKQMMQALKDLGQESDFDDRRPCHKPLYCAQVTSYQGVKEILQNHDKFHVPCESTILQEESGPYQKLLLTTLRGPTYQVGNEERLHAWW